MLALHSMVLAAGVSSVAADYFACNFLTDPTSSCMLPWPDNFFLSTTWNNNTDASLTVRNATFPLDDNGKAIDVAEWNELQGFGTLPQITAFIPGVNLALSGAPRLWNISSSLDVDCPTILFNTATMEPVMHWVELDYTSNDIPGEFPRALLLWPAEALNFSTTYIVAFRNFVDDDGVPIAPSDGFGALKYNKTSNNPLLEASRPRYAKIFDTLDNQGWSKQSLTLAWEFTTNNREDLTGRFVSMRDDAFTRVDNGAALTYGIASVVDTPNASIYRTIKGWLNVPLYLNTFYPGTDVRLVLDPRTGLPVYQGMCSINFTVLVPASLAGNATTPPAVGKVVQYGHGLFGDQSEVETGYLDGEANQYGYVLGAVDWWGLSAYDEPFAAIMVATDLTNFPMIPDRCHQGMLNALLLMKLMTQSSFVNDPAVTFAGVSVISPSERYYYGNSQGGIMGAVYMAVSTDVTRGVSGVGGGPYGLLLPRSADFVDLFDVIKARYSDPVDRISLMAVLQALWDRMEPSAFVRAISREPLPNTPPHTIIFEYGLGDAQVSWLGCQTIARSAGSSMFASNVREGNETLSGFPFVSDTTVLSGVGNNLIQGWDFGVPEAPFINIPPNSTTDTHERTRRTATAQAQMARFFTTGEIYNACAGPCYFPTITDEYL